LITVIAGKLNNFKGDGNFMNLGGGDVGIGRQVTIVV